MSAVPQLSPYPFVDANSMVNYTDLNGKHTSASIDTDYEQGPNYGRLFFAATNGQSVFVTVPSGQMYGPGIPITLQNGPAVPQPGPTPPFPVIPTTTVAAPARPALTPAEQAAAKSKQRRIIAGLAIGGVIVVLVSLAWSDHRRSSSRLSSSRVTKTVKTVNVPA
jgi:hypothetical protein